jgi:TRAP-type C4-dicarboxylate transport system substrate-binding protein
MKGKKLICLAVFTLLLPFLMGKNVIAQAKPSVKPLVLRFAHMSPPRGTQAEYLQKACKEVEKGTEGRVKIEIYWSESLVKVKEMPKAIQRGVCDIAWVASVYHPAEVPLWTHYDALLYLPGGEDAVRIAQKAWEMFDESAPLRGDFEKLGQTAWLCTPYDSYCMWSKKVVKNLGDMKGIRVRVSGEGSAKCIIAAGAHPSTIPASETYTALEKGTVDAAITGWEWGKRYGFFEVVPYVTDLDVFGGYAFMNVSLSTLRKMSEGDRKLFLQIGRKMSLELGEAQKRERQEYKEFVQGKGLKLLPFPNEERTKWAELPEVKAMIKNWLDRQKAAGRPGSEVMKTFLQTFGVPQWMPPGY